MARKKRASNGMGSVRQRKDGRWEGRYTMPDGRQRSVYAASEAEVTRKLREQLHQIDRGIWAEPSRLTLSEWLHIWLDEYQAHVNDRTRHTYGNAIRLHIEPVIGHVKMVSLTPLHCRRVMTAMQTAGLSANYIRSIHGVLSVALNAAIEAGIIKSNPAEGLKRPRVVKMRYNIVDRENIPDFINAAMQDVNGLAIVFLLLTGLRAAEERGLQWSDVDLDNAQMHIRHQIPCRAPYTSIPPKDGSTRTIELTPEAVHLLRQRKVRQAEQRLAAGSRWYSSPLVDDLVFRTSQGRFLAEAVLYRAVREVGAKIGMPALHPHDLRHSYAVAALRSGIDVKTVQNNLGHKNAAMTLDTYAAYTTDAGKVGAELFSAYWKNALKCP